ncbi:hypothetical protein LAG90_14915 [Marinilongibacter aquaticus]|uniref:hypothetical protein n=1 Tax=Marinilongibacter aquaticus TaxID=2975157 RepID=UPI0021BD4745|nr:hypothetical protein [Marinilongibacter aquaticus]UBM58095.1 hypothetical protein LAG90_14915 [Marinilongibacter aquaticus]
MKIHSLLLLCLQSIYTFAQQSCPPQSSYGDLAFDILKHLDKSQVPTGILYENVFPLADIYNYTGLQGQTDTSNTAHFLQAYAEIYRSAFNNAGMKHYQEVYEEIADFHPDHKYHHPVGIIDYNFNTLAPDAVDNNLLSVSNNQLYDVPGRSSSPYLAEKAAIAGLLMAEDYPCLYPGQHAFHFSSDFVLSNSGFSLAQVSHMKAVYNNAVIFDSPVSGLEGYVLNLTVSNEDISGLLVLILTVGGVQQHYVISTCQLAVDPPTDCEGSEQLEITGYAFDGGYGEGSYAEKGLATFYYSPASCSDKRLRKPIVFIDGFDPGNQQHHENIWAKYLNKLFNEPGNPNAKLGDELLSLGYDIIILDQMEGGSDGKKYNRGGTGLIENNGLVLAKLLDSLYTRHHSTMTEDFVVVGASMGGLVARYGLAWMESNNLDHHTRLFISFDSPQNGAQIPLGMQQMVDHFTQYGGAAFFPSVRNMLHYSNAAKQMLLHHSDTQSESVKAHPFYTILRNNLAAVGDYPSQCRTVAINNGNRWGIRKNIPMNPNPDQIPTINDKGMEADMGIKRRGLFGLCNSTLCYKLRTQIFAQTASNRNPTNKFVINTTNLLNFLTFTPPFVAFNQYAVAENGTSYDIAPGSRLGFGLRRFLDNAVIDKKNINVTVSDIIHGAFGKVKVAKDVLEYTNFVPTVSSSAYTFPNNEAFSIYKNFNGVNLSRCAGTTPFDTVYAPSQDMQHVSIDAYVAGAFREEVYNLKARSSCGADCPEHLVLNSSSPTANYRASKSISLLPGFRAVQPVVLRAAIGCESGVSVSDKPSQKPVQSFSVCPFNWDPAKNEVLCGAGVTTFRVYVKNLPLGDYAEFSTNGNNWNRATVGDEGWTVSLSTNPGQVQVFYARPHTNPSNTLQGWLSYCP